ncbi:MAG: hypothetical protein IFK94_14925, partial [Acidobacteria bacterium]|nr:hypothetical protein [Candidatus Polarisedimenticola svalbardensis]
MNAQTLDRPVDAVVVKGSNLPGFSTNPPIALDRFHLYRWTGSAFEPIPFQFDEIKEWDLYLNTTQCLPCAGQPGCTIPNTPVTSQCETNYAFDFLGGGTVGTDESPGIDDNDELVFLARDAGSEAPEGSWLAGSGVHNERYDIRVADEEMENNEIQVVGVGYVYLFQFDTSHATEYTRHYIDWEAKGTAPDPDRNEQCHSGDPDSVRGSKACGWFRANPSSGTGQASYPTLDLRYIGNWTINRLKYRAAGAANPNSDVIDRLKYRLCAPGAAACETEYGWGANGCPLFLGLKSYPGNSDAPVRGVRTVQGALSGTFATRTDYFLGTHLVSRVRLRVHNGTPPLRQHIDFLEDALPLDLYTALYPPTGSTIADVINGLGADHAPVGSYSDPDESVYNWNQFGSPSAGQFVQFIRETRPLFFEGAASYYYDDTAGEDDEDNPQHEPKTYGNPGAMWGIQSLDMQDLTCRDIPDDPEGKWREVETYLFAIDSGRTALDYLDWLQRPLRTYPVKTVQASIPDPPAPPCEPSVAGT